MKDGELHRGRFPNNRRFFLEYRCPLPANGDLCNRCLEWKARGKTKDIYRAHYGLITDPLPETCHIFGSVWYEAKVKDYGSPSEEDMRKAMQAQLEAKKGLEVQAPVKPEIPAKPIAKRGRKKKVEEPIPPLPLPPPPQPEPQPDPEPPRPDPVPNPPKPASKRRTTNTKAKAKAPVEPKVDVKVPILAVEVGPPLKDLEVVKIVVRPFPVNDTLYFRDAAKNKLYAAGKDKRPSHYVGRWNPEEETIDRDFPDSDAD